MPQAVNPRGKSMAKVVRVNAADGEAVLYRNLGNGRRLPFIWGNTFTMASGATTVVVSSGVSFNAHEVATRGIFTAAALDANGAVLSVYFDKDTANNIVTLTATSGAADTAQFDVTVMLGIGYNFISTHTNQIFWQDSSVTLSNA
ncbi:MAG: hypothetical protein ACXADW_10750 [Candidatus Hodarchaeales archaeon]|jgi:hypothetical protein